MVSFGRKETRKKLKNQFLIIDCKSVCNYIIGRLTLFTLEVVSLKVHLILSYHTNEDVMVTMEVNFEVYRLYFLDSLKLLKGETNSKSKEPILIEVRKGPEETMNNERDEERK